MQPYRHQHRGESRVNAWQQERCGTSRRGYQARARDDCVGLHSHRQDLSRGVSRIRIPIALDVTTGGLDVVHLRDTINSCRCCQTVRQCMPLRRSMSRRLELVQRRRGLKGVELAARYTPAWFTGCLDSVHG